MVYERIAVPSEGKKIGIDQDGNLQVPDNPIVCFIEGDGTGPDIWAASQPVLDAAVAKAYGGQKRIVWMEVYAGDKANSVYQEIVWLPQETLDAIDDYMVRSQRASDHAGGRRHPQHQRGAAPETRSLCLCAPGAVLQRRPQPGEAAATGGYGDLSREHRGYLRRHRV